MNDLLGAAQSAVRLQDHPVRARDQQGPLLAFLQIVEGSQENSVGEGLNSPHAAAEVLQIERDPVPTAGGGCVGVATVEIPDDDTEGRGVDVPGTVRDNRDLSLGETLVASSSLSHESFMLAGHDVGRIAAAASGNAHMRKAESMPHLVGLGGLVAGNEPFPVEDDDGLVAVALCVAAVVILFPCTVAGFASVVVDVTVDRVGVLHARVRAVVDRGGERIEVPRLRRRDVTVRQDVITPRGRRDVVRGETLESKIRDLLSGPASELLVEMGHGGTAFRLGHRRVCVGVGRDHDEVEIEDGARLARDAPKTRAAHLEERGCGVVVRIAPSYRGGSGIGFGHRQCAGVVLLVDVDLTQGKAGVWLFGSRFESLL